MFRDVLLDRMIFAGVTFFVLVIGAQLYRWHSCSTTAVTLAAPDAVAQQVALKKEPHPTQETSNSAELEVSKTAQTHLSKQEAQTLPEAAKAFLYREISKDLETMEVFLDNKSSICRKCLCVVRPVGSVSSQRSPRGSKSESLGLHSGRL
ncbi:hypothetical protein F4X10_09585 [Candidatus Poribacteria bacterium]|nr:hypothetical protein [Candidatus Poribacteria bacterium]